jgi:Transposase DDE domain
MPDLNLIEHHPQRVVEAFRRGEFDQIEIVGQADEKEFFELCFKEKMLDALAGQMPTPRKKEEVPLWFVLAANLSLKLHLENAFHAFERVVRCGGLLSAMPPEIASKHLDPQTRQILLECQGFNDKNTYQRSTPCDQDFLRKFVKEVSASQWMEWFNGPVQQVFQSYGFFDPAGVFIGDGSYLFVPDNQAYEGSAVMWFDEHNHPVDYEKLTGPERKKAHRERCYKLVSLLHLRGDSYVYAGLAVVPGNAHENPVLYELVENFVRHVGRGVMKLLILDRGFIDGPNITRCKTEWGIDVLLPVKKNMDIWADAWALSKQAHWQPWSPPAAPSPAPPANRPEAIVRRELKRQKTLAAKAAKEPPPPAKETLTRTELCPIKGCTSWTECQVPMNVLLLREQYADGHQDQWALMTTADFADPAWPKEQYQLRTTIEERHRLLKCFYDLSDFHSRSFHVITAQVVFILLSYTLRQWQLWRLRREEELAGKTPGLLQRRLNIHSQYVVIYHQHAYTQMPLVTFTREVLELAPEARARALAKIRKLENSFLTPLDNVRAPP